MQSFLSHPLHEFWRRVEYMESLSTVPGIGCEGTTVKCVVDHVSAEWN